MYAYNCHVISKFISVMSNQIIQNTGKSGEYINGHKELMVICGIIERDSENTQTSTQTAPVIPQGQPFSNEEIQIETFVSQALELAETDSFLAAAERLRALKQQYPHNTVVNFCYSFYEMFFHNDWNVSTKLNNIFASYEQFLWRIKNSTLTSEEHESVLIAYGNDLYGVCRFLFNAAYEDSGLNQNPNNSKTVKALNVFSSALQGDVAGVTQGVVLGGVNAAQSHQVMNNALPSIGKMLFGYGDKILEIFGANQNTLSVVTEIWEAAFTLRTDDGKYALPQIAEYQQELRNINPNYAHQQTQSPPSTQSTPPISAPVQYNQANNVPAPAPFMQREQGTAVKSRVAAGLLNIFLPFGAGRFYLGHIGLGVGQLLTVPLGFGLLWSFIDGILIVAGAVAKTDAKGNPLK
jgi:TM2 domain-containing membrane protein YozV